MKYVLRTTLGVLLGVAAFGCTSPMEEEPVDEIPKFWPKPFDKRAPYGNGFEVDTQQPDRKLENDPENKNACILKSNIYVGIGPDGTCPKQSFALMFRNGAYTVIPGSRFQSFTEKEWGDKSEYVLRMIEDEQAQRIKNLCYAMGPKFRLEENDDRDYPFRLAMLGPDGSIAMSDKTTPGQPSRTELARDPRKDAVVLEGDVQCTKNGGPFKLLVDYTGGTWPFKEKQPWKRVNCSVQPCAARDLSTIPSIAQEPAAQ